jgi:hypothetical protein
VAVLLTALLSFGAPAGAGNWHTANDGLICSDCHVMHGSRRGIAYGGGMPSPTGYPSLLKAATPSQLCLTCHDGTPGTGDSAPDVAGAASYETAALKRSGGAFQAAPGIATVNGHNLDVAGDTAPGGSWSSASGLNCVDCHAAHGNAYYRNLLPQPGTAPTARPVTAVSETATTPTATQYSVSNVRYTNSTNGLALWCQGCHTNFHGQPGDANMGGAAGGDAPGSSSYWFRHPTRGITMAQGVTNVHIDSTYWFSTALSRVPVVSPSGVIPGASGTSDNEVFCGSCHKAHGSTHRDGLVWDDASTSALEDGTLARQTCQSCHYH